MSLRMPARRFFAVLREARDLEEKRQAKFMYEMVRVALCAQGSEKYVKALQGFYHVQWAKPKKVDTIGSAKANDAYVGNRLMHIFQRAGQNG